MKTISDLAMWWAENSRTGRASNTSFRDMVATIARGLDETAKRAGYTVSIAAPPTTYTTVAAWRIEMQRICKTLRDIEQSPTFGLTEHEYAHNAKLRKLWQAKADAHRAAYPSQVQA